MPVGEQFIVAFDPTLSPGSIDSINAANGVVSDHLIYGFESVYLLRNTDSSGMRILDLANYYHDIVPTHFAYPEFAERYEKHSYQLFDFYRNNQSHLKKVIGEFNQRTVWDFAGCNDTITVAIIDDGVEAHEDLPGLRILPGHDFIHNNPNSWPVGNDAHGMGCPGIIAASHTTDSGYLYNPMSFTGIFSLDPWTKIMPLKIFEGDGGPPDWVIASAINWAFFNDADVISNSYGKAVCISSPLIDSALQRIYNDGRNGLGMPAIFSSGNGAEVYPSMVAYPACSDYAFAVGAVQLNDERWYYSQYGSHLDVVAPSGDVCLQGDVWTLDRMDWWGFNDGVDSACGMEVGWNCPYLFQNDVDYDCHFGGTSAACPIVSGIASLLIARNPELTVDQIYDVLRYSAVTDLDWGTITPHDLEYGYGRVDAFRAMLAICRGDANNDGAINIGDQVHIVNYIFRSGPEPQPDMGTGDADCSGAVEISDAVYLINYIFKEGPAPGICFEYDY